MLLNMAFDVEGRAGRMGKSSKHGCSKVRLQSVEGLLRLLCTPTKVVKPRVRANYL